VNFRMYHILGETKKLSLLFLTFSDLDLPE